MKKMIALALVGGLAWAASAEVYISEIFCGLDGPDGTVDWFEITYTGPGTFDTAGLWYEDDSLDPLDGAQLGSHIMNTGDSVVVLTEGAAAEIAEFQTIWGNAAVIVLTDGPGLGQGGDTVALFDGNGVGANLITSQAYTGNDGTQVETYEYDAFGNESLSAVGVNGAYAANPFFNDSIGAPNNMAVLIGSPGVIPAPGAVALLGLGGLFAGLRRR